MCRRGGGAHVSPAELLGDVLAERVNPGRVLDYETDLDGIGEAYAAMAERRAIRCLVRAGPLTDPRQDGAVGIRGARDRRDARRS